jgi:hypothetical protein
VAVILPNAAPPLIVSATLTIGVAILFEAGLSFLGLGDPNVMSWGLMIGANREYILDAWWPVTFPGLAIFLTVFAVSLIGDGLNDALQPQAARTMSALLEIEDLRVIFRTRYGEVTALDSVSMHVNAGRRWAWSARAAAASRSPRCR